ncbi:TetR family transcriptional regulator [Agrobacterium sp. NPDC090283]|uniref:TetR family transcriptional regulator n=1 Tax=Agrobacterium sp. NPDC090283 TaxID=3363920 RepID=UPI003839E029
MARSVNINILCKIVNMTSAPSLKELKNDAVSASIAARALALFDQKGFDGVTVDDIAAASGISRRSFFRYFPTKEDVVVGSHAAFGPRVTEALIVRPQDEGVWLSLRRAFDVLADNVERDPDTAARTMRVVNSTASLRAHSLEKHIAWGEDLAPEVARRLGGGARHRLEADTLVHAAFACLDVALAHFSREPDGPIHDLLDAAFAAVTAHGVAAHSPSQARR